MRLSFSDPTWSLSALLNHILRIANKREIHSDMSIDFKARLQAIVAQMEPIFRAQAQRDTVAGTYPAAG